MFNVSSGYYTIGEVADYVKEGIAEGLGINARIVIRHKQDFRNYKVCIEKAESFVL